jgi:Ala-tRNA(Pro) deacylase
MADMADVYKILRDLGIAFREYRHPAVFTVEEAEKHRGTMDGAGLKNLFLRNKKGDKHYLLTADAQKKIDIAVVARAVGEKKLSFASAERLKKYLGVSPGSVSPLGIVNDEKREVVVLLDKEILAGEKMNVHPNVNTATLQISKEDFFKFLEWAGNETREIEL